MLPTPLDACSAAPGPTAAQVVRVLPRSVACALLMFAMHPHACLRGVLKCADAYVSEVMCYQSCIGLTLIRGFWEMMGWIEEASDVGCVEVALLIDSSTKFSEAACVRT